jgi:hypothetical protein
MWIIVRIERLDFSVGYLESMSLLVPASPSSIKLIPFIVNRLESQKISRVSGTCLLSIPVSAAPLYSFQLGQVVVTRAGKAL